MSQLDDRGRRSAGRNSSQNAGRKRGTSSGRSKKSSPGGEAESRVEQIARITAARQSRGNNSKRRRKPPFDFRKVGLAAGILVLSVICVVIAARGFGKKEDPKETRVQETELQKEVTVNGVSIAGLTKEEAKEAVLNKINWDVKIRYKEEEEYQVANLLEPALDELLEEIYRGEPKDAYTVGTAGLEEGAKTVVQTVAKKWDVPARNGAISSYDEAAGKFLFSGESDGVVIDQEQLLADLTEQLSAGKFQAELTASGIPVKPEITEAQARESYTTLGTFSTRTTNNKDRNTNITIAVKALNGKIIQPGEEFSFNNTTGNRTTEKGYRPAGAYVNGVLVEEPGGGVCQVSSTLYNAVVFSGLTTTERHAHSYEPSYVTPGEDAMVSYDGYAGPDMRFVNNSKDAVGIRASFSKNQLTISIYGIRILEEGVKLTMESERVQELATPEPTYEEDQTLQPGEEVTAKNAVPGSKWVTNLVTWKDGEKVKDEFFHNSIYKGKPATIKRNTSGVVIPKPGETAAGDSSASSSSGAPEETGTASEDPSAGTGGQEVGPGVQTQPSTQPATQAPVQTTEPSTAPSSQPATQPAQGGNLIAPNPLSQTTQAAGE